MIRVALTYANGITVAVDEGRKQDGGRFPGNLNNSAAPQRRLPALQSGPLAVVSAHPSLQHVASSLSVCSNFPLLFPRPMDINFYNFRQFFW